LQPFLLGDVVISVETAARQAQRRGHSLREELQILLVHGILHLLGYDHEISRREAVRMRRKEGEVRAVLAGNI
jgi:rRNA maturation RNase YbeY